MYTLTYIYIYTHNSIFACYTSEDFEGFGNDLVFPAAAPVASFSVKTKQRHISAKSIHPEPASEWMTLP